MLTMADIGKTVKVLENISRKIVGLSSIGRVKVTRNVKYKKVFPEEVYQVSCRKNFG